MNPEINTAWKKTCKVLLGDELGELKNYEEWLLRYVEPFGMKKSAISGKDVIVSSDKVPSGSKFLSLDEMDQYMREVGKAKFNIDDVKDLDSIIAVAKEKAFYIGNVVLGNSRQVETSNRCINSSFIYKTQDVYDCKFVAYSSVLRFAEYIFGGNAIGEASKFNIKTFETYKNVRCMETIRNYVASDCYFTGSLENCTNCMFSFNQRNKSYLIGNCQFSSEEYHKLKEKLICDMRDTLKSKKALPSLIDIVNGDVHG
ncbi:Uncharacterised protein [Candidatus Bilamarchaeum dharawalense]|uniref:Uncharacterized protein n=1 Tax=Candidatus Bilamarchaeum dharawalense TaxID=2885759 RepID=A0A5E4LRY8_9ARCH|nr:Uncharacterised protein [Candidatus Bilamarchaeum dharawalense]